MNKNQKETLFENIDFLLKKKGIRKSELEAKAGVSPGYLSRFKGDEPNNLPSLSFVETASRLLETDMDTLINFNIARTVFTDNYVTDLLLKLIIDTREGRLKWKSTWSSEIEKTTNLSEDSLYYKKDVEYSLEDKEGEYETATIQELGFRPMDEEYDYWYCSELSEPYVSGKISQCTLKPGIDLLMLPISRMVNDEKEESWTDEWTLWIVSEHPEMLAHGEDMRNRITQLLEKLQSEINDHSKNLHKENKLALDEYLYGRKS